MIGQHESVVVTTFVRAVAPVAQLFALYVLVHGHESPGGGFQAGVILGATAILRSLALGRGARRLSEPACLALAVAGVALYVATGLLPLARGGVFLDYAALPAPLPPVQNRYLGILLIEAGVTVTVAATLLVIFRRLADR